MAARYETAKERQLSTASRNRGRSAIAGTFLDGGSIRGWKPFRPCICVTEPCPCDDLDDLIIWVPSSTKPTKTATEGKVEVPLDDDAEVLVELQIAMTISQLRQLKEWGERGTKEVADDGNGTTTVAKGKPLTPAKAASAAFAVGFALGEKIDEAAGLSDKISDFAAEHFPWPF